MDKELVIELYLSRKMTQTEIANKFGVHRRVINRIIRGKTYAELRANVMERINHETDESV